MNKYLTLENAEKAYENDFDESIVLEIMELEATKKNCRLYENEIRDLAEALDTYYLDYIQEMYHG